MAEKKIKVRFLTTRVVEDGKEGTQEETRFEAGKVYPLPESSARRWIDRKVAVLDDGKGGPVADSDAAGLVADLQEEIAALKDSLKAANAAKAEAEADRDKAVAAAEDAQRRVAELEAALDEATKPDESGPQGLDLGGQGGK
jgi:hypothetical protein